MTAMQLHVDNAVSGITNGTLAYYYRQSLEVAISNTITYRTIDEIEWSVASADNRAMLTGTLDAVVREERRPDAA